MHLWGRSKSRRAAVGAPPPWMRPLPTGPVRFDPTLRRAGDLARQVTGRPPRPGRPTGRAA